MKQVALKRMTIFIDESSRFHGHNLSTALLERMRKEGIAGATVLRGSSGYGSHGQIHTTSIVDLVTNLPVILIAVDAPEKIDRLHPMLDEMVKEGLVIIDDVVGYVPEQAK
jgi:PII-like signaling protein